MYFQFYLKRLAKLTCRASCFVKRKKEIRKKGAFLVVGFEQEKLISLVINIGFQLHRELGPGLLESVYQAVLAKRLERNGVKVVQQMPVDIMVDGVSYAQAYRVDLFLNDWLVVELKAHEKLTGVHVRQAVSYVTLLNQPTGLLLNFGAESFKGGVRRVYSSR
jgi:GxxExxY protein